MRTIFHIFLGAIVSLGTLSSCETIIDPKLEEADDLVTVDAWINNKPGPQVITLALSQPYFDNSLPPGISSATVTVENLSSGKLYLFDEVPGKQGSYVWTPASITDLIGQSGDDFRLLIQTNGESYESFSSMGRVPAIDSITFTFQEENSFQPDSYFADFWATDPSGSGDTYWIKAIKNDTLLNKPAEISLAFDAGFSSGGNFDGVEFIPPIRQSINPFDLDEEDNFLSPYDLGDSVYVEIHAITLSAFNYLTQVVTQTNRPGGFSELFSTPLANVSTNINNINPGGRKALGFFNVAAVSGAGKKLVK